MEGRIQGVRFRGILESRGQLTVEAEIRLSDGSAGVGSAPVASHQADVNGPVPHSFQARSFG